MWSQRDDFVGGLQTVLYKHREIELSVSSLKKVLIMKISNSDEDSSWLMSLSKRSIMITNDYVFIHLLNEKHKR